MIAEGSDPVDEAREIWWRRWLVTPVKSQLKQGISTERISWTIALGIVLGVFPILGTPTVVCLAVGCVLRLNHVVMQVFKEMAYPLHLALILVFIRLGERLHGAPLIRFSIPDLLGRFQASPLQFASDFGLAAWHGISAWLLIAPVAAILIKWAVTPGVRRIAATLEKRKEAVE